MQKPIDIALAKAMIRIIDAKDRYTNSHSQRVAHYAAMIAKFMGKSVQQQTNIYMAGLLHDVGKIRIPDAILNKNGRLSDAEFEMIKLHPVIGYHILKDVTNLPMISMGAKYHHERYDGMGYPNGLAQEEIPEIARIIGVADAYDAMTSTRSYRDILPQEKVRSEIIRGRGKQFDPEIAAVMLERIDEDTGYNMRQQIDFRRKILAVDDQAETLHLITNALKDEPGYTIHTAKSGLEALALYLDTPFDLAILDVQMPGMDGFELYRKMMLVRHIPVVFLTASSELDTILRAERAGVDDYLVKPIMPQVLREIVSILMMTV